MRNLTRIEAINQAVGRKRLTGRYVNERKIMSQSQFSKKTLTWKHKGVPSAKKTIEP